MKAFLLCIIVVLGATLRAQTLPTQFQHYDWNVNLFDWVLRTSESYQYDDRDSVRVLDRQSSVFGLIRNITTTDEAGNLVEELFMLLDSNNVWQVRFRNTETPGGENTRIRLQEAFEDGEWKARHLINIYTQMTEVGVETDEKIQILENGEWVNNFRQFTIQNDTGRIITDIQHGWENDEWVLSSSWKEQYNEQGDRIYYENQNVSGGYIHRMRWSYTYNTAMQPTKVSWEKTNTTPPNWQLITTDSFAYDIQGRQKLHLTTWNVTKRVRQEEIEYRGDTAIASVKEAFNSGLLQESERIWLIEGPEEYGPHAFLRVDEWVNGKWAPFLMEKRTFRFDQYDNLVRSDYEKWIDQQWQAHSYQTYNWEYRDDGKPIKMISANYDFNAQFQSPIEKKIWRYEDRKKRSDRPMIEIAPNPSRGPLNIVFHTANVLPLSWKLIDERGRIVRSAEISEADYTFGMELYIEALQAGLYILQVVYEDGRSVAKKWQKI